MELSTADLQNLSPDGFQLMLVRPAESGEGDASVSRFDLEWFWRVIRPYRTQMGLIFLTGFTNKLLEIGFTLAILQIVDGSAPSSWPIGLLMSLIGKAVLALLQNNLIVDLSDRIDTNLGSQVGPPVPPTPEILHRRTVGDFPAASTICAGCAASSPAP